jgi:hypothetical protein
MNNTDSYAYRWNQIMEDVHNLAKSVTNMRAAIQELTRDIEQTRASLVRITNSHTTHVACHIYPYMNVIHLSVTNCISQAAPRNAHREEKEETPTKV